MKQNIIRFSRGPQFHNGQAALPFMGFLFLLVISIVTFLSDTPAYGGISLPIALALFVYVLDLQGVEVDLKGKRVRDYTIGILGKRGEWVPYSGFDAVVVDYEEYNVKVAQIYSSLTNLGKKGLMGAEEHKRFVVVLRNRNLKDSLLLGEREQPVEALRLGRAYAKKLKLPLDEKFRSKMPSKRVV